MARGIATLVLAVSATLAAADRIPFTRHPDAYPIVHCKIGAITGWELRIDDDGIVISSETSGTVRWKNDLVPVST